MPIDKTAEGNKLIAEFDGLEFDGNFWYRPTGNTGGLMFTNKYKSLRYHLSIDWMLPVIIKTGEMWRWKIDKFGCTINVLDNKIEYGVNDTNSEKEIIHCVWLALVEFIKWYNPTH